MTTTTVMRSKDELLKGFTGFAKGRESQEPGWLLDRRRHALARFDALGFPTLKHEDWRWTSLNAMQKTGFRLDGDNAHAVSDAQVAAWEFEGLDTHRLVFVNGHHVPALSRVKDLPAGTIVRSLTEAVANHPDLLEPVLGTFADPDERAFVALNAAFMTDGGFVHVPDGSVLDTPVHILHLVQSSGEPIASHPRSVVIAGAKSKATVIESFAGLNDEVYLTNPVTEMVCGDGAEVTHVKVQRERADAFHVANVTVRQGADSRFLSTTVNLGGAIARNEYHAYLGGERADCTLNGLSMGHDKQVVDNHTRLDHAEPHCTSWQVFKSILDDKARGVFDGKIHVHRDAQKTDAKQTAKSLILSDNAVAYNKPQLEIYADDVKCTHGATTGQLDSDSVFYLQARGLSRDEARSLLTYAFAREVANTIELEPVRREVEKECLARLPGDGIHEAL